MSRSTQLPPGTSDVSEACAAAVDASQRCSELESEGGLHSGSAMLRVLLYREGQEPPHLHSGRQAYHAGVLLPCGYRMLEREAPIRPMASYEE